MRASADVTLRAVTRDGRLVRSIASFVVDDQQEIKVVWRMTGSGDLSINATGPDGKVLKPEWGPESHGSSNWDRPGDEWGTGWVFPSAGCWTINATRTNGSGYLVLRVGP